MDCDIKVNLDNVYAKYGKLVASKKNKKKSKDIDIEKLIARYDLLKETEDETGED